MALNKKQVRWEVPAEFIGVQAAAMMLGISEVTVRRLLTLKKLKRYKVGGRTVVSVDEVRRLPVAQ